MVFENRSRYLEAMRAADDGNPGRLAEMIARGILDSLHRFVLPMRASDDQLVPTVALANEEINDRALRMAATRGRLRAIKRPDNTWMSTREWRDEYLRDRYKRGRNPHGDDAD